MPFTSSDALRHKRSLTEPQQAQWARIANGIRRSCITEGGEESVCDVRAIRIANSRVPRGNHRMNLADLEAGIAKAKAEVLELHYSHAQISHGRRMTGVAYPGVGGSGVVTQGQKSAEAGVDRFLSGHKLQRAIDYTYRPNRVMFKKKPSAAVVKGLKDRASPAHRAPRRTRSESRPRRARG